MHLGLLVFGFAVAAVTSLQAQEITAPTGDAILTITGGIAVTNVGETLVFDLDSLMALPSEIVETETIWTTDIQKFKGVSLVTLVTLIGADDGELLATAINDYTVSIPISDAIEGGPIIAYMLNDQEMSVRDKGPLWLIYPYDSSPDYRTEVVYSRSIWQLDRIELVE